MSFSGKVKDELSKQCPVARHCQIAEVAAIISLCGRIGISQNDTYSVRIHTENIAVARKYFTLLKKAYNIDTEISIRQSSKLRNYTITIKHHKDAMKVLQASKLIDEYGEICENLSVSSNILIQKECCKRAFIRGAFLASGSISAPEKFYHLKLYVLQRIKQFN